MRRAIPLLIFLNSILACFQSVTAHAESNRQGERPPNVIVIVTHDQSYGDVGAFLRRQVALRSGGTTSQVNTNL